MNFRFARATNDFAEIKKFYMDGLGLSQLGGFVDHEGFDGIMLGMKGLPYHLEFTKKSGHKAPRSPSDDLLLVFYHTDHADYILRLNRMKSLGFSQVKSFNPYWDEHGATFQDFEGFRVVLVDGPSPY